MNDTDPTFVEYAIEARPGVFICPPQHLAPGSPEAAIAAWSPETRELVADRQTRERAARTEAVK